MLLTFYDFPAEHWIHLRTTNPIESTFATVRLRHRKTKGNGTRMACLTMVYKLMQSAAKRWRLLNGSNFLPDVIAEFNSSTESNPKKPPPDKFPSTTFAISPLEVVMNKFLYTIVACIAIYTGTAKAVDPGPCD